MKKVMVCLVLVWWFAHFSELWGPFVSQQECERIRARC